MNLLHFVDEYGCNGINLGSAWEVDVEKIWFKWGDPVAAEGGGLVVCRMGFLWTTEEWAEFVAMEKRCGCGTYTWEKTNG